MFAKTRSLWVSTAMLAYLAFAVAQARESAWWLWFAVILLPLVWIEVWRRTRPPKRGEDGVSQTARAAFRATVWGSLIWLSARSGTSGAVMLDAAANLGTGVAAVASLVALARLRSPGGLLAPPRAAVSLDAAAFAGIVWGAASSLPAALAALPAASTRLDPLTVDYATATASIGSLLLSIAAAWRLRWLRRLELGVGDRASAALALTATVAMVAVPAALLGLGPPDRVLPATVLLAAMLSAGTTIIREPTWVASALRGILAVLVLGAPITLVSSMLARALPAYAPSFVLASSALAIAIGIAARTVARPLAPEQSRWLDAIESAARGALQPEPDSAIRAALDALRDAGTSPEGRPELWRFSPKEVLSVDIAGYLHVAQAEPPPSLIELALREPERTVRAEALRAVQVRRPEVRPLLHWFDARTAFSATLILDEDGPLGFLLMPRGSRTTPLSLEEAQAMRTLADRVSALLAVSSALARSRERELAASQRIESLSAERDSLTQVLAGLGERHAAEARRWERRVRTTTYCPPAKVALEHVERLSKLREPLLLEVPPGSDPVGWSAFAHLAGTRPEGPFVVVDATAAEEQSLHFWEDPSSAPWRLVQGGTLVVTDVGALPHEVQDHLAAHVGRSSLPGSPPPWLVLTTGPTAEELRERKLLSPTLLRLLRDRTVPIPSVSERAEDLRALLLEAATRWGLRTKGVPIGAEPSALRWLVEHPWSGGELEIDAVMLRAVKSCDGSSITAHDLQKSGFAPADATEPPPPALPQDLPLRRAKPRWRGGV